MPVEDVAPGEPVADVEDVGGLEAALGVAIALGEAGGVLGEGRGGMHAETSSSAALTTTRTGRLM